MKLKKFKVYEVISKLGNDLKLSTEIAVSRQEVVQNAPKDAEVIRITEITNGYPISKKALSEALTAKEFGKIEQEIIFHLVENYQNLTE